MTPSSPMPVEPDMNYLQKHIQQQLEGKQCMVSYYQDHTHTQEQRNLLQEEIGLLEDCIAVSDQPDKLYHCIDAARTQLRDRVFGHTKIWWTNLRKRTQRGISDELKVRLTIEALNINDPLKQRLLAVVGLQKKT